MQAASKLANKLLHDDWLQTAIEYKVGWANELERRQRYGLSGPEPLPHPDDILIDFQAGTATIRGPMTKEDKANWDFLRDRSPVNLTRESVSRSSRTLSANETCEHNRYADPGLNRCGDGSDFRQSMRAALEKVRMPV